MIASHHDLPHLGRAEARLGAMFARPALMALACVVTFAASGWAYLGIRAAAGAGSLQGFAALCRPFAEAQTNATLLPAFAMWAAMTLAMMLPTASGMIVTYAEIADTAARQNQRVVSPFVLTAGYVAVWLAAAAVAALVQVLLTTRVPALDGLAPAITWPLAGIVLIAAGAYQFSALKHACLHRCQRPFAFFFARWSDRTRGVFQLGLRQGLYCLGCCWAMMLAAVMIGAMNLLWMVVLGIVTAAEKMTTTRAVSHAVGGASIAAGIAILVEGVLS